jgi:hypothetical protein
MPDPYKLHKLSLGPLLSNNHIELLRKIKHAITDAERKLLFEFIINNGLGPAWHEITRDNNIFSAEASAKLDQIYLYSTAQYLRQQFTLQKIDKIFSSAGILYAVFKGAHVRELVYDNPAVRGACDIDILIAEHEKLAAIKSLVANGFTFHPSLNNISHQVNLTDTNATIDLHWNILRPGRTRTVLTDKLLATKQKFTNYWGLNDEATLFLMLVHPVFSEYATTPYSSLMRVVDLAKWLETRKPDWGKVSLLLEQAGLQTAAWVMLVWLKRLTESTVPHPIYERLKPGSLRAQYLRHWINQDFSTRLLNYPVVVQGLFTLPVHDRLSDVIRALGALMREKRTARRKMDELRSELT